jgi:hypothetical protein
MWRSIWRRRGRSRLLGSLGRDNRLRRSPPLARRRRGRTGGAARWRRGYGNQRAAVGAQRGTDVDRCGMLTTLRDEVLRPPGGSVRELLARHTGSTFCSGVDLKRWHVFGAANACDLILLADLIRELEYYEDSVVGLRIVPYVLALTDAPTGLADERALRQVFGGRSRTWLGSHADRGSVARAGAPGGAHSGVRARCGRSAARRGTQAGPP